MTRKKVELRYDAKDLSCVEVYYTSNNTAMPNPLSFGLMYGTGKRNRPQWCPKQDEAVGEKNTFMPGGNATRAEAVADTLNRIRPGREIKIRAKQADGVQECGSMLKEALEDRIEANFLEGMDCPGGCVGGPKAIIDPQMGRKHVNQYGEKASSLTPMDNKYVMELLKQLGIEDIHEFLNSAKAGMFIREF